MEANLPTLLTWIAIVLGFFSAASWLRASAVKVTTEKALARYRKEAERKGVPPFRGSASLDGWDMSATFVAQSKWNALGALLAASSITLQAISQLLASA